MCVCVCVCVLHVIAQAFTNYHSVRLVKARCSFRIPPKPLVIEHLLAPLYDLSDSHNMGTREEYTTGGGGGGGGQWGRPTPRLTGSSMTQPQAGTRVPDLD